MRLRLGTCIFEIFYLYNVACVKMLKNIFFLFFEIVFVYVLCTILCFRVFLLFVPLKFLATNIFSTIWLDLDQVAWIPNKQVSNACSLTLIDKLLWDVLLLSDNGMWYFWNNCLIKSCSVIDGSTFYRILAWSRKTISKHICTIYGDKNERRSKPMRPSGFQSKMWV